MEETGGMEGGCWGVPLNEKASKTPNTHPLTALNPHPPNNQSLPLAVDLESLRPAAAVDARLRLPPGFPTGPSITKRDVHGNVGVVIIYVDWPGAREPLPRSPGVVRPAALVTPQQQQAAGGGRGGGGGAGSGAGLGAAATGAAGSQQRRQQRRVGGPSAVHRWELLRAYVRFRTSRRRQLLEAWWGAVAAAVKRAEAAARVAEVAAWKTLGQAVQVSWCWWW